MNAEEKLKEIMEAFEDHLKWCQGTEDYPEGMVNITISRTLADKWVKEIKEILK